MSDSLAAAQRENNAAGLTSAATIRNSWREATRHLAQALLQLFRRGQSYGFPCFETAGHGADIFVAHFLQALGGERGATASAAMTNDHCVGVGDFFLDIELDRPATHVNRVRNMFLVPFVFLANIDNHRFTVFDFSAVSLGEISVIFFFASATNFSKPLCSAMQLICRWGQRPLQQRFAH